MESKAINYFTGLKNKNITVVGFGVSNRPLVTILVEYGANVTICDKKNEDEIRKISDGLDLSKIKMSLGESYLKNLSGDIIFRTPGIRPDNAAFIKAEENGSIITSEMEVFFDLCPCKIIAVTGSDGKTTSTTLIYNFLKSQGYKCHLGGNIGKPLLPDIFNISPSDFCVIELSSFQLQSMKKSPYVAVVTNVAPNHLDWHTSMDEYIQAKKNVFKFQKPNSSRLTLNLDNEITRAFAEEALGEVNYFSSKQKTENCCFIDEKGDISYLEDGETFFIMNKSDILLPGDHNIENYMTAIAATWGLVDIDKIAEIAKTFGGVEHRMEFVTEINGIKFYNDSIGTSPTRTIAGLKAQKQKIILIAGGYDKKIPFEPLAPYLIEKVKTLILMGNTAPKIEKALKDYDGYSEGIPEILYANSMEEAVSKAYSAASKGDIIYLSPASASFDLYPNFEERGNHFKDIVRKLN